jgi:hypothetical protein
MRTQALAATIAIAALASCQSELAGGPLRLEVDGNSAIAVMQAVAETGRVCWIKSGDRAFRDYHLVPELDTRVGKPRILLVRRSDAQGLPALVIEATEKPVTIDTYGPLASKSISSRINTDVQRWATGGTSC